MQPAPIYNGRAKPYTPPPAMPGGNGYGGPNPSYPPQPPQY